MPLDLKFRKLTPEEAQILQENLAAGAGGQRTEPESPLREYSAPTPAANEDVIVDPEQEEIKRRKMEETLRRQVQMRAKNLEGQPEPVRTPEVYSAIEPRYEKLMRYLKKPQ